MFVDLAADVFAAQAKAEAARRAEAAAQAAELAEAEAQAIQRAKARQRAAQAAQAAQAAAQAGTWRVVGELAALASPAGSVTLTAQDDRVGTVVELHAWRSPVERADVLRWVDGLERAGRLGVTVWRVPA